MKRVRHRDRIHRGIGKGDRLSGPFVHAIRPQLPGQQAAQLRQRLHGDHVKPIGEQRARQLAGPCAQVEDRRSGRQLQLGGQRTHGGGRVIGATTVVNVCDGGETLCEWMQRQRLLMPHRWPRIAAAGSVPTVTRGAHSRRRWTGGGNSRR